MNVYFLVVIAGIRAYVLGVALLFVPVTLALILASGFRVGTPGREWNKAWCFIFLITSWSSLFYQMFRDYGEMAYSIQLYELARLTPFEIDLSNSNREAQNWIDRTAVLTVHLMAQAVIRHFRKKAAKGHSAPDDQPGQPE